MKLKSLKMKDFRCFSEAAIEFDHINIVLAPNATGKSSIREAIDYALTARTEHTDRRGAGAEYLIRDNGKKAVLELDIDSTGTITRTIPNSLQVPGKSGTTTVLQQLLYDTLKADGDLISAAINTSRFIEASSDDQKNMLFGLLGLEFDKANVLEHASDWLKRKQKDYALEALALLVSGVDCHGTEAFDRLEAAAVENRKGWKRTLVSTESELQTRRDAPANLPEGITEDMKAECVQHLKTLKAERDGVLSRIGKADNDGHRKTQVQGEISDLETQVKTLSSEKTDAPESMAELNESLGAARAQLADRTKMLPRVIAEIARLEADIDRLTLNRSRLVTASGKLTCQASGGAVECPLSADDLGKVRTVIEQEIAEKRTALENARKELSNLQAYIKEGEAGVQNLQQRLLDATRLAERLQECEKQLKVARNLLEAKRSELKLLGDTPDTETLAQQKEELEQRIARGEGIIAAIDQHRLWKSRVDALESTRVQTEAGIRAYDALAEAFSPEGIRSTILSQVIDPLRKRAKERLEALTAGEYSIEFDLADGFNVFVLHKGTRKLLRHLSKSEKLRVGILLQDVLNYLAGLRLLVIDEADMLDQTNRDLLNGFLLDIAGDYDTILVLATVGEVLPKDPGIEGLAMFTIADGQIVRLKKAG